jgi:tRNA(Ile)-lysidine synthase
MTSVTSPLAGEAWSSRAVVAGEHVLVGVSGGADSVALAHVMAELAREGRITLSIGHVHHGLRGAEADRDASAVATLAVALGVPALERRGDAAAVQRDRGRGPEEAARALRLGALSALRREAGADVVALAHSLDDQAETLLLRLVRGTGPPGLAGMRPRCGRLARPFLAVRRRTVREHLVARGIAWRSDASNWGGDATRALIRPLLARLEEQLGGAAVAGLGRLADLAADEHELLEALVSERGPRPTPARDVSGFRVRAGDVATLAGPLARRWLRRHLASVRGGEPPPSEAVARVLALSRAEGPDVVRGPGFDAWREGDDLVVGTSGTARARRQPATKGPAG